MNNIVSTGMYEIGADGLKPVVTTGKVNNLERGRVLYFDGYDYDKLVIIENLGINEHFPGYGSKYLCVNLRSYDQVRYDAHSLKFIADKKDNRIQVYITDEVLTEERIKTIWEKSEAMRREKDILKIAQEKELEEQIQKGKLLFEKYIPRDAKALIVACHDIDDCDIMTDYFNVKTGELVVLGWSKHTRDDFREMRKYADKIPETTHLKNPPIVDEDGEEKTEFNKSWWTPSDEHREKYSMGRGYYLKAERCYGTGWTIKKVMPWSGGYNQDIFTSLAKRCIFEE